MCGLFGVMSSRNLTKADKDFLWLLAHVSYVRGKDATGMVAVDALGGVSVHKETVDPATFLSMSSPKATLDKTNLRVVLGHTRAKTYGENTRANAHPFDFDNVVGMHNGTIDRLCKSDYLDAETTFNTDSEGLYNQINKSSVQEVVPKLEGAWALTMWDKTKQTLNIVRNDKRPLWFLSSEDKEVVFWASEEAFLLFAAWQTNYPIEVVDGSINTTKFPENSLLTVEILTKGAKPAYTPLKSTKVYSRYTAPVNNRGVSAFRDRTTTASKTTTDVVPFKADTTKSVVFNPQNIKPRHSVVNGVSQLALPVHRGGGYITSSDLHKTTDRSCLQCGGDFDFIQGGFVLQKEDSTSNSEFVGVCHRCVEADPNITTLLSRARFAA